MDPGIGAVVTFRLDRSIEPSRFVESLRLPLLGVSLGGVESIVTVPARHSHASVPEPERRRRGITDDLVRFSVGLEEPEDLLADLASALDAARIVEVGTTASA
jgi:cystathionine beta-lyase